MLNFAVRIVVGLRKYDHVSETRDQFIWGKLETIIEVQDCSFIKRAITCPCIPLREKLHTRAEVTLRQTRATAEGQLQLPKIRTELARRGFLYRAAVAWNRRIALS